MGIYTRTLTWGTTIANTGWTSTVGDFKTYDISGFTTIAGDTTHTIKWITNIQFTHYHSHTNSPIVAMKDELVFSDGTTLASDYPIYQKFSGNVLGFTNIWSWSMPISAEKWSTVSSIKHTYYWRGYNSGTIYTRNSSTNPIRITLTFSDQETPEATMEAYYALPTPISYTTANGYIDYSSNYNVDNYSGYVSSLSRDKGFFMPFVTVTGESPQLSSLISKVQFRQK